MHEMGIIMGVMQSAEEAARDAHADRVVAVTLDIGMMTEAIQDALEFAYEALSEGTMFEGSTLTINMIEPRSVCIDCGCEFDHDRYHLMCPECGSFATSLIKGREMRIASIEVETDDEDDEEDANAPDATGGSDATATSATAEC